MHQFSIMTRLLGRAHVVGFDGFVDLPVPAGHGFWTDDFLPLRIYSIGHYNRLRCLRRHLDMFDRSFCDLGALAVGARQA